MKQHEYTIVTRYSHQFQGYEASCMELPGCACFDKSQAVCVEGVNGLVRSWMYASKRLKFELPEPDPKLSSGTVTRGKKRPLVVLKRNMFNTVRLVDLLARIHKEQEAALVNKTR